MQSGTLLSGNGITNLKAGGIDTTAPGTVNAGAVAVTAVSSRVEMQWPAALDDPGGSGIVGYEVSRGGIVLGRSAGPRLPTRR